MPWFFSGNSIQQSPAGGENEPAPANMSKSSSDGTAVSTALERAAKAAKVLETSKYAKQIQELYGLQNQVREERNELYNKHSALQGLEFYNDQRRKEYEKRRKTLADEAKQQQVRVEYENRLAQQRYEQQLAQQKQALEETLRKQEESVARQESIRRQSIEQELDALNKGRMDRIVEELRLKARIERENHDLNLEEIRLEAKEHRQTVLEGIRTAGAIVGSGLAGVLADPNKIVTIVSSLSALALGIYTSKRATGIAARYIESRINTPSLVNETSRIGLLSFLKHPLKTFKRLTAKPEDSLKDVILNPELTKHMRDIAVATKQITKHRGWYPKILLYGPPGTGKTMFAKKLAEHSGMDYAIMSGGNIGPMGQSAVTAIDKLLDWSQTSRRGLLLFVDEADAFLRNRTTAQLSENLRAALTVFLTRTSENSPKFMLVLASNIPEQFDSAMVNRLDDLVEFGLPGSEERERLLMLYFQKYVLDHISNDFKVDDFNYAAAFKQMAKMTEGMSARHIAKLGAAWQSAVYIAKDHTLSEDLAFKCCRQALERH